MHRNHIRLKDDAPPNGKIELPGDFNCHLKPDCCHSELLWGAVRVLEEHRDHGKDYGDEECLHIDAKRRPSVPATGRDMGTCLLICARVEAIQEVILLFEAAQRGQPIHCILQE